MTARCGGVGRTLRRAAARLLLVSLAALTATACGRTEPEAVRVEAVERFERLGSAGADAVLRVHNGTGHTLKIRRVRLDVFYAGKRVGSLRLHEPVRIPRRATTLVGTRWRLETSDPMAFYVVERRLGEGDLSRIGLSYELRARSGVVPVKISGDMMPLSEFLNTFGLSEDDIKEYLK